ncbi:MAG: TIGR04283 family arsenosugar biosynthesis glycosyltransferase [Acidobacteriaceae bacterium]|nr:TIGR04283 family arsenosugar biosynthesis glycosyltransferase [Acidobacteriaceae bacterium]
MVSIIVPTLNEEAALPATLRSLHALEGEKEVIVADGGSTDCTIAVARELGARVVQAVRGRGSQMHAGAVAATGEIFWFVHADTTPPPHALRDLQNALMRPGVAGGNFGLTFDGCSLAAKQLTLIYPLLRILNLCYGDSGIFLRREIYENIGGFQPLALFEDLDLLRRLRRRGKFIHLACRMTTSSRRFKNRNFLLMWTEWTGLQLLYWCGADPNWLARRYKHVRTNGHQVNLSKD